jgi:thioredoxin reductase (NADPH)
MYRNQAPEIDIDPASPDAREAQTFPRLIPEMMDRVVGYGREEKLSAGVSLFERGQRSVDFFVVIEGSIEMFDYDHHEPRVFATLTPRQFTGELDLFNDRKVLVSGRTGSDSRIIRIPRIGFRQLVTGEPDIGEIILRAFVLRRVGLIRHSTGGTVLIGPGHIADTLRLERFLTRNGYPHRLLDTESDPAAGGFLDCFSLSADELPVVIVAGCCVIPAAPNWPTRWA